MVGSDLEASIATRDRVVTATRDRVVTWCVWLSRWLSRWLRWWLCWWVCWSLLRALVSFFDSAVILPMNLASKFLCGGGTVFAPTESCLQIAVGIAVTKVVSTAWLWLGLLRALVSFFDSAVILPMNLASKFLCGG